MNIEGLSSKEIQQQIFDQVAAGANPQSLKEALRLKGVPVEGYYFTTRAKHTEEISVPAEPAGKLSGMQIFWGIVTIIILVVRIARCSSRM